MNETEEKLEPYGTKLPPTCIKYLRRFPGGAAKLLRTLIAERMKRDAKRKNRKVKVRA